MYHETGAANKKAIVISMVGNNVSCIDSIPVYYSKSPVAAISLHVRVRSSTIELSPTNAAPERRADRCLHCPRGNAVAGSI